MALKWGHRGHMGNGTRRDGPMKSCKMVMRMARKKAEAAHRVLPDRAGI